MLETLIGVIQRIEAGIPTLVAERRIGYDVIEGLEGVEVILNLESVIELPCTMSAACGPSSQLVPKNLCSFAMILLPVR